MTPLKEHPYIFANGKFKIEYWNRELMPHQPYRERFTPELVKVVEREHIGATLMARPVDDMSDSEIKKYIPDWQYVEPGQARILIGNMFREGGLPISDVSRDGMLYLLSIGVYPFDHAHFDDGKVIELSENPEFSEQ